MDPASADLLIRSYGQVPHGQPYTHVRPSADVHGHPPVRTPVSVLLCCTGFRCTGVSSHTRVPLIGTFGHLC